MKMPLFSVVRSSKREVFLIRELWGSRTKQLQRLISLYIGKCLDLPTHMVILFRGIGRPAEVSLVSSVPKCIFGLSYIKCFTFPIEKHICTEVLAICRDRFCRHTNTIQRPRAQRPRRQQGNKATFSRLLPPLQEYCNGVICNRTLRLCGRMSSELVFLMLMIRALGVTK